MPANDRHAEFMDLFLENQPRIYGYVRTLLLQKADADDVMQETAAVLWTKFDEFEGGTHFDRWAFRVAQFRQAKARESKRLQFSDDVVALLAKENEPFLEATEEVAAALEVCLRKLEPADRQLVAMRFEEKSTNRSVAGRIGKSESVVSRRLSRIYDSLMHCISLRRKLDGYTS